MNYEFKVAWCPYCDQGWVEIVKNTLSGDLLILCAECDTIWRNPEDIPLDKPAIDYLVGRVEAPSFEAIKAIGWDKNIIKD
jgi:hypothetical protein